MGITLLCCQGHTLVRLLRTLRALLKAWHSLGNNTARRVHPLTVKTPLPYSPVGLDPKLVKTGPGGALKPRLSGVHFRRLGNQIQGLLRGRFTSSRSSPTGGGELF